MQNNHATEIASYRIMEEEGPRYNRHELEASARQRVGVVAADFEHRRLEKRRRLFQLRTSAHVHLGAQVQVEVEVDLEWNGSAHGASQRPRRWIARTPKPRVGALAEGGEVDGGLDDDRGAVPDGGRTAPFTNTAKARAKLFPLSQ